MNLTDYAKFDALGLSAAIASGDLSRDEAVETSIEAMESLNSQLNAVVIKNYESARQVASNNSSNGPLAGVPFLLKDVNVFTHDMPTTFSCRFFNDASPRQDSEIVKRWRNSGLVLMGKTNTPEFAEDFVCEPSFRGPTLNPWDLSMTTGGSSGGAGVAVASGMVPIAHGTDLGGSIRIPAACCGVYGLKPTTGLTPVGYSHQELASGFNSDHVLTRSVRDSAAALDVTAIPLIGNRYQVQRSVPSYLAFLDEPARALRIGVCDSTPSGEPTPDRQRQAVQSVSEILSEDGHQIVDYRFPQDLDFGSWMDTLWMFDVIYELEGQIALMGRDPEPDELEAMTHYMRECVDSMSAMDHYHARLSAHQNSVKMMHSLTGLDLLLTPALGSDPVAVGTFDSRTDAFDYEHWARQGYEFAPFSYICNITGQPAASLPVWLSEEGPPCAVQLAAQLGQDHLLLQISAQLEKYFNWGSYHPPIWVGN
jgi:amidase